MGSVRNGTKLMGVVGTFQVAGRGDDHVEAGLGEELINLGTAFDGARLGAIRPKRHQVVGEGEYPAGTAAQVKAPVNIRMNIHPRPRRRARR